MPSILVVAQTSRTLAVAIKEPGTIFSHKTIVFALPTRGEFCVMQSRLHQEWVGFFGSSMKDDDVYTPTDCYGTFPFPNGWHDHEILEQAGRKYHAHRRTLMTANDEGLTKTYNRFHSPDERDEGILELRRLHGLMDGAVLRAYGWDDLADKATCEFLLDYEEEENDDPRAKKSKKKKPWRYRWPDEFRDEVLARLLELNEQRHKEEVDKGLVKADGSKPKTISKNKSKRKEQDGQKKLF
jgi:hypothetical protein